MSSKYENESYVRCVSALKARYSSRGINADSRNVSGEHINADKTRNVSENYYAIDSRAGAVSSYRSGEHKGNKYMTSEDFVRYFRNRHSFVLPTLNRASDVAQKSASAREGRSDSKEGHIRRAVSALNELRKKWLPIEQKEGRTIGTSFKFPAAAVACIAVFAISLGLIVSGSVMIGNASGQIGSLNTKISVLEAKESELQSQLDLKYDIEEVKKDAEAMGMISSEFAGGEYLKVGEDEEIEVYDQSGEKTGFSALLSAIGIDVE